MAESTWAGQRNQRIGQTNPWLEPSAAEIGGGAEFGRMIEALRRVHETSTAARPPAATITEVADALERVAAALEPYAVPEREQITGHRTDLPGRGQALTPAFTAEEWDDDHVAGRVTFGRYYLGGNGAAHGGAIPLVFDEVMGRLANVGRPVSRTAYLHVNYRRITPIGPELRMSARFDREEGRKRFLTAEIRDGENVLADAEGLFVALKPGQP